MKEMGVCYDLTLAPKDNKKLPINFIIFLISKNNLVGLSDLRSIIYIIENRYTTKKKA